MRSGPHHSRKAIPLLAAFSLLLKVLMLGSVVPSTLVPQATAAHPMVDCPEHDDVSDPADHSHGKRARSFCCIPCDKIGTGAGPTPVAHFLPVPQPLVLGIDFGRDRQVSDGHVSVLLVGARAPPLPG